MATIGSITISGGSKPDLIIPINKAQNLASEIQAILDANIPISYGFATYTFVGNLSFFNWQAVEDGSYIEPVNGIFYDITKSITASDGVPVTYNVPNLNGITEGIEVVIQLFTDSSRYTYNSSFGDYRNATIENIDPGSLSGYDLDMLFEDVGGSWSVSGQYWRLWINGFIPENDAVYSITENEIEDSEFKCVQPDFIGGVEEGSSYVLISAPDTPNGVRVYVNTGEFGYVKSEKCLIKLDAPLIAESEIWCYISTDACNVESCKYVVGAVISGNDGCLTDEVNLPQGTLVGTFICLGVDYYAEEWDGFGNKVLGTLIQEDCIYCGGELPNCEEVP